MGKDYYKVTYRVVVLSEEPYEEEDLIVIASDIISGDCSGSVEITETEILDGPSMAKALMEQNSDPEFFGLEDVGLGD